MYIYHYYSLYMYILYHVYTIHGTCTSIITSHWSSHTSSVLACPAAYAYVARYALTTVTTVRYDCLVHITSDVSIYTFYTQQLLVCLSSPTHVSCVYHNTPWCVYHYYTCISICYMYYYIYLYLYVHFCT